MKAFELHPTRMIREPAPGGKTADQKHISYFFDKNGFIAYTVGKSLEFGWAAIKVAILDFPALAGQTPSTLDSCGAELNGQCPLLWCPAVS